SLRSDVHYKPCLVFTFARSRAVRIGMFFSIFFYIGCKNRFLSIIRPEAGLSIDFYICMITRCNQYFQGIGCNFSQIPFWIVFFISESYIGNDEVIWFIITWKCMIIINYVYKVIRDFNCFCKLFLSFSHIYASSHILLSLIFATFLF